jgi:hypothetical protein
MSNQPAETIGVKVGAVVQTEMGTGTFRRRNMGDVVEDTDGTRMTNKVLAIRRMAISYVPKVAPVRKVGLHDVIVVDHGNPCGFSFR